MSEQDFEKLIAERQHVPELHRNQGRQSTEYDAEHINAEYARIDTDGTPGYFTGKAGAQSPVMGDVNADGLFNIADVVCTVK